MVALIVGIGDKLPETVIRDNGCPKFTSQLKEYPTNEPTVIGDSAVNSQIFVKSNSSLPDSPCVN